MVSHLHNNERLKRVVQPNPLPESSLGAASIENPTSILSHPYAMHILFSEESTGSLQNHTHLSVGALEDHTSMCLQILADVDQEAADVSETLDGAGHNLLMSARHVWDEHLQRRAHTCITTLATLQDNLSARTRTPAQPQAASTSATKAAGMAAASGSGGGGVCLLYTSPSPRD